MLNAYLAQFQALIQAPSSSIPLISTAQATVYVNDARQQVAAEGECIRELGNLVLTPGTALYGNTMITTTDNRLTLPVSVRMAWLSGNLLDIRPWEWFFAYYYGLGATGTPQRIGQQGQGTSLTLYLSPTPAVGATILVDAAWLPIPLADDTTQEAIPYPWTDAVPFWAAWLGLQSLQRQADADAIMQRYQVLMRRARDESSPSVLPGNLPGDIGTKLAASKTTLTEAQAPGAGR